MSFPKTFKKGDQVRVVNTPADEVSAQFNGFKEVHDVDIEPNDPSGFVVDPVDPTLADTNESPRERRERKSAERRAAAEQAQADAAVVNSEGEVAQ